jgi:tetratricopeptide (TPR) repeat protein
MIQSAHGTTFGPDLYMRLADLYSERARYAWLVQYERQKMKSTEEVKAVESPEARLLKNLAISTYSRIIREFPTYPKDDEALFLSAHEYRELGDFDKMKESYEHLISTYPSSSHLLEAYLALGDHAFDANDVKTAEKYYDRILAAPASPIHALARYKLAWIRISAQECPAAVNLFEAILHDRSKTANASLLRTQKNLNVLRESLIDLAYCYPEVYPEKPPVPYFKALATSTVDYVAAMRRLANRFVVKEMHPRAAAAYREVLDGSPSDDDSVEIVRRFYSAVIKGNVYDQPGPDIDRIVTVLDARLRDYRMEAALRPKLVEEFEAYARDIATRAQLAAKAAPTPAAMSAVADGYLASLNR